MEKLTMIDEYSIKNELALSNSDLNVLTRLYLPIIGRNAFTFYLALTGESNLTEIFSSFFKVGRLTLITDLTLEQIFEACNTLEGIGLIRTYLKYGEFKKFIFEIHHPLTANQFFHNQIYNVSLYRTLKQDDYEKTKYTFMTKEINLKEYEDVSSSFKDAFYFNYNSTEGANVLTVKNIRDNAPIEANSDYDLDLFYKELAHLQVRRDTFNQEEIKLISQYGLIYSLDGITLANLVLECLEEGKLNIQKLSAKVKTNEELDTNIKFEAIYRQQPYDTRSNPKGNDRLSAKIRQMETISPYDYIQAKQQSTPTRSDLAIVEKCMVDIGLNAGVMNVLLDTTWALNDGRMPKTYMEKVAASWQRKGIRTVKAAMEEAKGYLKAKNNPTNIEEKEVEVKKKEVFDEQYIQNLMKKAGL